MSEARLAYIIIAANSIRPDDSKRAIIDLIEEAALLPSERARLALYTIAKKILENSRYDE